MYKFEIDFKSLTQHYPLEPIGNHYPTSTCPTNDDLLRLIASAMGYRLDIDKKYFSPDDEFLEYEKFKKKFTFKVEPERKDYPVTIFTEYEKDFKTGEFIRSVDYIVDAGFKITVFGKKDDLLKAIDAFNYPWYPYNLGGNTPSKFRISEIEEVKE